MHSVVVDQQVDNVQIVLVFLVWLEYLSILQEDRTVGCCHWRQHHRAQTANALTNVPDEVLLNQKTVFMELLLVFIVECKEIEVSADESEQRVVAEAVKEVIENV